MTFVETMQTLESLGTEQNRKVYRRHGAGDVLFGVSFADLRKLEKQIKTDHDLAERLWKTGNADARTLAMMIADPLRMTAADLERWLGDIRYYMLADLFARYIAAQSPAARLRMNAWMKSDQEHIGQAVWDLMAIRTRDSDLDDAFFEKQLGTIEKTIHKQKNRVRHAMNGALIAIGMRNTRLQKLAIAAARRIGKVEVDHGETNCKSPDAESYILKAVAYRKSRKK